jgi:hypothetical protein
MSEYFHAETDLDLLAQDNARLTQRLKESEAEAKKYHDALIARHGGEPIALLDELDIERARVGTLEEEKHFLQADFDRVEKERVLLDAALRRAEQDSARLDWLEDRIVKVHECMASSQPKLFEHVPAGYGLREGTDLRRSIRAAMLKPPKVPSNDH